jgi:catechol 2,3-dioxygenase-like lactoylglutathione lyase family enzyme
MFDRIHHAGVAVADLVIAKRVFADGLGLRVDTTRSPLPEGNKQRSGDPTDILDVPIGDAELELNAPPSDGTTPGGTHRFIQGRGGVGALHHICLHSDNVAEDVEHLRASGLAQLASPEEIERGPWDEVAFFHPRDCLGVLLEVWPPTRHRVGDEAQGHGPFTRLRHIGVVTDDLEKARRFWCNVIGLRVDVFRSPINKGGRYIDSDNVRVLNIPCGKSEIVAILPQDQSSGTARFLAKYGGRAGGTMHHISLGTKDVKAAADFVQSNGLELIGKPNDDVAWVHPKSAAGTLIQIIRDDVR